MSDIEYFTEPQTKLGNRTFRYAWPEDNYLVAIYSEYCVRRCGNNQHHQAWNIAGIYYPTEISLTTDSQELRFFVTDVVTAPYYGAKALIGLIYLYVIASAMRH